MAVIDLLLVLLVANGETGQNAWCWVSMTSGTAFCDYRSLAHALPPILMTKAFVL